MRRHVPVLIALLLVLVLALVFVLDLLPFFSPMFRFVDSPLLPPGTPRSALSDPTTGGTSGAAAERPLNRPPPPWGYVVASARKKGEDSTKGRSIEYTIILAIELG
jgi:hypothetical protein